MARHRWVLGLVLTCVVLGAAAYTPDAQAQNTVVAYAAISGQVLPLQLATVGQTVKQGDPLLFVRTSTAGGAVIAARSPANGKVVQVLVNAGDHVNTGDPVVVIQP
jgi:biotin carboxyl carrier protein